MPTSVIVILSVYVILWQGYKLRTTVSGFGQVALTGALISVLAIPILVRLKRVDAFGELDPRWIKLIGGILVLVACLSFYLFRLAIEGQTVGSPQTSRALVGSAVVATILIGIATVAVQRNVPLKVDGEPWVAAYFVVGSGYFAYLLYSVTFWMFRISGGLERHLRLGLRIAAVGLLLISTQTAADLPRAFVVMLGGPSLEYPVLPPGTVSAIAAPLAFGGLSYPLIAARIQAFRRRRRQLSVYSALRPLWEMISRAYPEIVLRRGGRKRGSGSSRSEFRYHRRIAECYDGLHRLRAASTEGSADRQEAANVLMAAMQLQEERHPGSVGMWDTTDADEQEVDLLVELAGAVEDVQQRGLVPSGGAEAPRSEGKS